MRGATNWQSQTGRKRVRDSENSWRAYPNSIQWVHMNHMDGNICLT